MFYGRDPRTRHNCQILFGREGQEFFLFDFETTGLDITKDRPIQIAVMKCVIHEGRAEKVSTYSSYIRQTVPVHQSAEKKHKISAETIQSAPDEKDVFAELYARMGSNPILCGYNIETFDVPVLSLMYERYGKILSPTVTIDVSEMARDIVPPTEKRKLEDIAKRYGLDANIQYHDAKGDIEVSLRVLNTLYQEYQTLPPNGTKRIYVNYVYFWEGYNYMQKGIYINTQFDNARLWYSTAGKCWCSAQIDLKDYDMMALTNDALNVTAKRLHRHSLTIYEFGKLKQKDFSN